jgi:hypothetical protein
MAKKAKANLRLTEELLETAQDMRASGLVSKAAHEKITMQRLGEEVTAERHSSFPVKSGGELKKRPPARRQKPLNWRSIP